jgi:hypothetical protein
MAPLRILGLILGLRPCQKLQLVDVCRPPLAQCDANLLTVPSLETTCPSRLLCIATRPAVRHVCHGGMSGLFAGALVSFPGSRAQPGRSIFSSGRDWQSCSLRKSSPDLCVFTSNNPRCQAFVTLPCITSSASPPPSSPPLGAFVYPRFSRKLAENRIAEDLQSCGMLVVAVW